MTEHRKRPRDRAQLAKFIVDIATGEVEDIDPASKKERPCGSRASQSGGLKVRQGPRCEHGRCRTQGGGDQGGYVPAFLILLMSRSIDPMVFDNSMRAFAISSIF